MSIKILPEWDDRGGVWRLAVIEGDGEPTWLPGAAHAGTKHRLWAVVAAAATCGRAKATSDRVGMKWSPETTSREDMRVIAEAAQKAAPKVQP